MELNYDWGSQTGMNQLNGNISSTTWKSKGDGVRRAYGFSYDAANRLLGADFSEYSSSVFNESAVNFDMVIGTSTIKPYDVNGNIRAMKHWGLKLNTSELIDQLEYTYSPTSNKLLGVEDKAPTKENKLGDFTDYNVGSNDYGYDQNGNLIADLNKKIGISTATGVNPTTPGAIQYNHLNLPYKITMIGKGTISYIYDANGNKLQKNVEESVSGATSKQTNTDYISGLVYEQNVLQFIPHEEGRTRITNVEGVITQNHDYFIKDHLGNVRMVLTDELQQDIYPAATLEGNITVPGVPNAINNEQDYYTINTNNVVDRLQATGIPDYVNNNIVPNNNPYSQTASNSQKLYKLEASGGVGVSGLGITLKVMSGDNIDIFGKSYYFENTAPSVPQIPALEILTGLLGSPTGAAAAKGATAGGLNALGSITGPINSFLGNAQRINGTIPKAYINYILLDDNFNFVSGNFSQVGAKNTLKDHYQDAILQNIPVTKNGYLYVYCSNESPVKVFFDNLQVIRNRGPLLEETHYYPFGLSMAGISSKAAGSLINRNKFNGGNELQSGEFSDGSGLEMYDAINRMYDPQLGRFGQIDKLADVLFNYSPYLFGNNNPILYNDPLGLLSTPDKPEVLQEVFVTAKKSNPWNNLSYASTAAWVDKQRGNGFNDNQINSFLDRQHVNNQARDKFSDAMSQAAFNIREAEAEYWKEQAEIAKLIGLSLVPIGEIGGLVGTIGARVINVIAKSGGRVLEEGAIEATIVNSRALGMLGEEAVGISGAKTAINVAGRVRIPDRLTTTFLEEVKNVRYQALTSQLKDFHLYSQQNNLQMILHTRSTTILSKPLQQLINNGSIIHKIIPGF